MPHPVTPEVHTTHRLLLRHIALLGRKGDGDGQGLDVGDGPLACRLAALALALPPLADLHHC